MTTSERITWLKNMIIAPSTTSILAYRTVCQEMLEHEEKYRWHDLRKNPEDLPKDGVYEVAVRDDFGTVWIASASYRTKVLCTGNKIGWGFRADVYHMDFETMSIIAWREIEPFEEVE